jgi:hypothetical protein
MKKTLGKSKNPQNNHFGYDHCRSSLSLNPIISPPNHGNTDIQNSKTSQELDTQTNVPYHVLSFTLRFSKGEYQGKKAPQHTRCKQIRPEAVLISEDFDHLETVKVEKYKLL